MSISQDVFNNAVHELKEVLSTQAELIMLKAFHSAGITIDQTSSSIQKVPAEVSISSVAQKVMSSMTNSSSASKVEKSKSKPNDDETSKKSKAEPKKSTTSKGDEKPTPTRMKCARVNKTGKKCDKGAGHEVDGEFYCKPCSVIIAKEKEAKLMKDAAETNLANKSSKAKAEGRASTSSSSSNPESSQAKLRELIAKVAGPSSNKLDKIVLCRKTLKDGSVVRVDAYGYVWDIRDDDNHTVIGKLVDDDSRVSTIFNDEDHKYILRHRITLSDAVQYIKDKNLEVVDSSGSENDDIEEPTDDELVISDDDE